MTENTLPLVTDECNTFAPISNQSQIVKEEKIVAPLAEVLNTTTSTVNSTIASNSFSKSLDELFPEQQHQEKNIKLAKDTLGALADSFTPEQLYEVITEFQYLGESWLDDYERTIFNGKTLVELLHEKGGI